MEERIHIILLCRCGIQRNAGLLFIILLMITDLRDTLYITGSWQRREMCHE